MKQKQWKLVNSQEITESNGQEVFDTKEIQMDVTFTLSIQKKTADTKNQISKDEEFWNRTSYPLNDTKEKEILEKINNWKKKDFP